MLPFANLTPLSAYVLPIHSGWMALWSPGLLWSVVQNTGWKLSAGNNKNIPLGTGHILDRRPLPPLLLLRVGFKNHTFCHRCCWFSLPLPSSGQVRLAQHPRRTIPGLGSLIEFKMLKIAPLSFVFSYLRSFCPLMLLVLEFLLIASVEQGASAEFFDRSTRQAVQDDFSWANTNFDVCLITALHLL